MRTEHVVVVNYDKSWKQWFEVLRERIGSALGDIALRIEHVGSTSVEGLSAKPIIDIDVVIKDASYFNEAVKRLAVIGYEQEGDLGITGREAFSYNGPTSLPAHHLYVCPEDSPELTRHLAFRDWLRAHPVQAEKYSEIKKKGARLFPYNIEGYMDFKSLYIREIYEQIFSSKKESAGGEEIDIAVIKESEDKRDA